MSDPTQDERAGLLSASAGERVYRCPGSLKSASDAIKNEEEPPPEALAEEGEDIHEAVETENFDALDLDTAEVAQNLLRIGMEALTDWQVERAIELPNVVKEQRMWIRREDMTPVASAKADLAATSGTEGLVVDYKSGYKVVTPARSNIQLRLQALALWHEHDKELTHIRVASAQYRLIGRKLFADYDTESLKESEKELETALWKAAQPDAPRVPGPWCTYCPARAVCREAAAYALLPIPTMALATSKPMRPQDLAEEDVLKLLPKMTAEELAFIYERSALVMKILRAVRSRLCQMPEDVINKVGLVRTRPAPIREVNDLVGAYRTLKGVLPIAEFLTACKVKVVELEKIFAAHTKHQYGSLKAARESFNSLLLGADAMRKKMRGFGLALKSEVEEKKGIHAKKEEDNE